MKRWVIAAVMAMSAAACSPPPDASPVTVTIGPTGTVVASAAGLEPDEPVYWTNHDDIAHLVEIVPAAPTADEPADAADVFEVLPGDVVVTRFDETGHWVARLVARPEGLVVFDVGGDPP